MSRKRFESMKLAFDKFPSRLRKFSLRDLSKVSRENNESFDYNLKTTVSDVTRNYKWVIEGFSKSAQFCCKELFPIPDYPWKIEVGRIDSIPALDLKLSDETCGKFYVAIHNTKNLQGSTTIEIKFSTSNNVILEVFKKSLIYTEDMEKAELDSHFSLNIKEQDIVGDILEVNIKLTLIGFEIRNSSIERKADGNSSYASPELNLHFAELFRSGLFADIIIKVEKENIKAHKAVVCARSIVLRRMFESEMRECEENVVSMEDLDSSTAKKFIEFLYSGKVSLTSLSETASVYYAADKYDVPDLIRLCGEYLCSVIDMETVFDVFAIAQRHNDEEAKKRSLDFFKFHFNSVISSKGWDRFVNENTAAAAEVIKICSVNDNSRSADV